MIGLMSLVSRSTVRLSSPPSSSFSSWISNPSVASSSTRCELSLFFSIDWMADRAPTVTFSGVDKQRRQLVDHRQVASGPTPRSRAPCLRGARARTRSAASARRESIGTARCRSGSDPCRRTRAGTARPAAARASRPVSAAWSAAAASGAVVGEIAPRVPSRALTDDKLEEGQVEREQQARDHQPEVMSSTGSTSVTKRSRFVVDLLVVEVRQAVQHVLQARRWIPPLPSSSPRRQEKSAARASSPPGSALRARAAPSPRAPARCSGCRPTARRLRAPSRAECRRQQRRQRPRHLRRRELPRDVPTHGSPSMTRSIRRRGRACRDPDGDQDEAPAAAPTTMNTALLSNDRRSPTMIRVTRRQLRVEARVEHPRTPARASGR